MPQEKFTLEHRNRAQEQSSEIQAIRREATARVETGEAGTAVQIKEVRVTRRAEAGQTTRVEIERG